MFKCMQLFVHSSNITNEFHVYAQFGINNNTLESIIWQVLSQFNLKC